MGQSKFATSLKALGIAAEPGMTMKEIAEGCGKVPREMYEVIRTLAESEKPTKIYFKATRIYFKAIKTIIPASIPLMAFAGTCF